MGEFLVTTQKHNYNGAGPTHQYLYIVGRRRLCQQINWKSNKQNPGIIGATLS